MPDYKPNLTGDSFLDNLIKGGLSPNPNYNPKTKKGALQDPFIFNANSIRNGEGTIDNYANLSSQHNWSARGIGYEPEEYQDIIEEGITPTPYDTPEEIQKARADNQSAGEQFGNFLMRAGVGEVVIGSLAGFGNIVDGVINSFTGDNFYENPWTQFWNEQKEKLDKAYEIHRANPNEAFDFGDFGWWTENAISVASTMSLMIPAAGWGRVLGTLGKIGKIGNRLNKVANWATKPLSMKLAKAAKTVGIGEKYSQLGMASKINRSIHETANLAFQSYLMRTGENMMEGHQTYNDVYANSLENLTNMRKENPQEFQKFLDSNVETITDENGNQITKSKFINDDGTVMSNEEIARKIASDSAQTTFRNDYAMLLMDMMQLKALGPLWGKGWRRDLTAREIIAGRNLRLKAMGVADDKLIADTFGNRFKENFKYVMKNPISKGVGSLELGEAVEEIYQGIQQEKGMEVASRYFDPNFTARTLGSYLTDGHIWEQGFWGSIGGIAFKPLYGGMQKVNRMIDDQRMKGKLKRNEITSEQYQQWKQSDEQRNLAIINGLKDKLDVFNQNMEQIRSGVNPFNYIVDPITKRKVIKDGHYLNQAIDGVQQELIAKEAIDEFVANTGFDLADAGIIDLVIDSLGDGALTKYFGDKNTLGATATSEENKALENQVVNRLREVDAVYSAAIEKFNFETESLNPFVNKLAARQMSRDILADRQLGEVIQNIDKRIAEHNISNADYTTFAQNQYVKAVQESLNQLDTSEAELERKYHDKKINKSAYESAKNDLNLLRRQHLGWLAENNPTFAAFTDNTIADGKSMSELYNSKNEDAVIQDFIKGFNAFALKWGQDMLNQRYAVPDDAIKNLINQKANNLVAQLYVQARIPKTSQDYINIYNDFALMNDTIAQNRIDAYINKIKKYLENADDLELAINNLFSENLRDKALKEAIVALQYGYQSLSADNSTMIGRLMKDQKLDTIIQNERNRRADANNAIHHAENNGVPTPLNNSDNTITDDNNDNNNDDNTDDNDIPNPQPVPSTGGQTQNNDNGASSNDEELTPPPEVFNEGEDNPINPSVLPDDDTKKLNDARTAVARIVSIRGLREAGLFTQMANALKNDDTTALQNFMNEIKEELIKDGFDEAIAIKAINKQFATTIQMNANSGSQFAQLANALAVGLSLSQASNEENAVSKLITGDYLGEAFEEFMIEFQKLYGNQTINGRIVINLPNLINDLLNNDEISYNTARLIYNNIRRLMLTDYGNKYLFTGMDFSSRIPSADEFFTILEDKKAQTAEINGLHINLVEYDKRTEAWKAAVMNAANGRAKVTIQIDKYKDDADNESNVIGVYSGGYKLGILRMVNANSTNTGYNPQNHYSGLLNRIHINEHGITECSSDELFEYLCSNDATAVDLMNTICDYRIKSYEIIQKERQGQITTAEAEKQLNALLSDELINKVINNPIIAKTLTDGNYKWYDKRDGTTGNKEHAMQMITTISNVLLYDTGFDESDPLNQNEPNFDVNKDTWLARYSSYKDAVFENYKQTLELQKQLETVEDKDGKVDVSLIASTQIQTQRLNDDNEGIAINSVDLDTSPNGAKYHPIVISIEGQLISEDGQNLGDTPINYKNYSMGLNIYRNGNHTITSFFGGKYNNLNGTQIIEEVKSELANLINLQVNRKANDINQEAQFKAITEHLQDIFGMGGLFDKRWIDNTGRKHYFALRTDNNNYIAIKDVVEGTDVESKDNPAVITFWKTSDKGRFSHAISIHDYNTNRTVHFDNNIKKFNEDKAFQNYINALTRNLTFRGSQAAITGKRKDGSIPSLFTHKIDSNGEIHFITHFNGVDKHYNGFGDLLVQTNGANLMYAPYEDGSFVRRRLSNTQFRITTKGKFAEGIGNEKANTAVSDLLYDANNKNDKHEKQVKTKEVLTAAGVPQNIIDTLIGSQGAFKLLNDNIYTKEAQNDEAFAFYDIDKKKVYVTARGANVMNNSPHTTVRLLIHENLHRLFNNKSTFGRYNADEQRRRILSEMREVYQYTRQQLEKQNTNGDLIKFFNGNAVDASHFYNSAKDALDEATSNANENTNMEEFIVESLSQKALMKWLNTVQYKSPVSVSNIKEKDKSIFQKIIDFLVKLFNLAGGKINDNTILAKQFEILGNYMSDENNASLTNTANTENIAPSLPARRGRGSSNASSATTNITNGTNTATIDTATLTTTENEVNGMVDYFDSRVKRSDNFDEDHTYLIDGQPADTSVTQYIHQTAGEIGPIGTIASAVGNTADDGSRKFFMGESIEDIPNHLHKPNDGLMGHMDNSNLQFAEQMVKLRNYLDNKHGKGKYRVITKEFPLAGIIDGKTIAGTMDMLVFDDKGNLWVYDFKTKRSDSNPHWDAATFEGYKRQVNIYRELIEQNFPQFKGRVKIGGLIKFNVGYALPEGNIQYKNVGNNQLQISRDGGTTWNNIETDEDYLAPILANNDSNTFVPVEEIEIKNLTALPEKVNTPIEDENNTEENNYDDDNDDDFMDSLRNRQRNAITEDILFNENVNQSTLNEYNNQIVNNNIQFNTEEQAILKRAPRNSEGKLIAPNGKVSHLTEKQYAQVRTKAFKEWFGDWENDPKNASKVIDENGEPLVVYHNSDENFNEFNIEFAGRTDPGDWGMGFYFAPKQSSAEMYGQISYPVFLNLRNPVPLDKDARRYFNRKKRESVTKRTQLINSLEVLNYTYNNLYSMLYNESDEDYIPKDRTSRKYYLQDLKRKEQQIKDIKDELATNNEELDKDLNKEFNDKVEDLEKYDGVIPRKNESVLTKDVYEIVVKNSNQIKSATDNNGKFSKENNDIRYANTDDIIDSNDNINNQSQNNLNSATPYIGMSTTEIYADAYKTNKENNAYGILEISDMHTFERQFPMSMRSEIRALYNSSELNYMCE